MLGDEIGIKYTASESFLNHDTLNFNITSTYYLPYTLSESLLSCILLVSMPPIQHGFSPA